MSKLHGLHTVHNATKIIEKMPPLKKQKNPALAAAIGFLFGPFGIGIYFASWQDFFVCLGLLIVLFVTIPGLGAVPGWLFSAGYGLYRAIKSNEHYESMIN